MAGSGWRNWATNETITESLQQGYLQDQVVMVYTTTTAADTALGGSKAAGMCMWSTTDNALYASLNGTAGTANWTRVIDDPPRFQGAGTQVTPNSGVGDNIEFSDASGSFNTTPARNVGGFVAETGGVGVLVPRDGDYLITGWATFGADASTTGVRRAEVLDNNSAITQSRVSVPGLASGTVTTDISTAPVVRVLAANDILDLKVTQTSGTNGLAITGSLTIVWLGP